MFHISDLTFLRNKHGWMDGWMDGWMKCNHAAIC